MSATQSTHMFVGEQIGAACEQSAFATHCTQLLLLHTGVAPEQSLLITHCTHAPLEQIVSSALPPKPGHCELSSHIASHRLFEQNGNDALQSANVPHDSATHVFATQTSPSLHMLSDEMPRLSQFAASVQHNAGFVLVHANGRHAAINTIDKSLVMASFLVPSPRELRRSSPNSTCTPRANPSANWVNPVARVKCLQVIRRASRRIN